MIKYNYCPICGHKGLSLELIENLERNSCSSCGWIDYRNPVPVACALLSKEPGTVLLVKRNIEPGIGMWALPGGFVELGETFELAGVRELKEETGLDGVPDKIIAVRSQKSDLYGYVLVAGVKFSVEDYSVKPGDDASMANFFCQEDMPAIPFKSHLELIDLYFQR